MANSSGYSIEMFSTVEYGKNFLYLILFLLFDWISSLSFAVLNVSCSVYKCVSLIGVYGNLKYRQSRARKALMLYKVYGISALLAASQRFVPEEGE